MDRKTKTPKSPKAKRIPVRVSERGFRFVLVLCVCSEIRGAVFGDRPQVNSSRHIARWPMSVIRSPRSVPLSQTNKSVAGLARLRSVVPLQFFRSARRSATPGVKKAAELRYRSPPCVMANLLSLHVRQYMRFFGRSKKPCGGHFNHDKQ